MPKSVLERLDYTGDWLFVNRAGRPVRHNGFHRPGIDCPRRSEVARFDRQGRARRPARDRHGDAHRDVIIDAAYASWDELKLARIELRRREVAVWLRAFRALPTPRTLRPASLPSGPRPRPAACAMVGTMLMGIATRRFIRADARSRRRRHRRHLANGQSAAAIRAEPRIACRPVRAPVQEEGEVSTDSTARDTASETNPGRSSRRVTAERF